MAKNQKPFKPLVCVVDFHHARGPEVEKWFGVDDGTDPVEKNDWSLLPFLALPDGAHTTEEELSYFTLRRVAENDSPPSSLFGISCTRQLASAELVNRPAHVTRSSVQKAAVVIVDSPYLFARIREQLSAVTKAWFMGRDLQDFTIIEQIYESIVAASEKQDDESDQYFGLSMREIIHEYKYQTLILFKCCLLQPKMLFFGANCEKLCLLQFSLISLIPGLIRNLQDCADTRYNTYEEGLIIPSSLKTSERASLLAYMGLPLQLFGEAGLPSLKHKTLIDKIQRSLFGPYTPLQQLDTLLDHGTTSYIVGSTNSLLQMQRERYCDIMINVDDNSISYSSLALKSALYLTASDRRWADFLTQSVNETWDDENPDRPTTHGYQGSEEFIRLQFEEYLLALVSAAKYKAYVAKHNQDPKALMTETEGDPAADFGTEWMDMWSKTDNFRIFNKFTDAHLFDVVEPRHPCAGGLTVEDIQRRVAQQVAELHLDERFSRGRETLNKHLATGQHKVTTAFNNLWTDIEVMREAQRKKAEDRRAQASDISNSPPSTTTTSATESSRNKPKAPDFSQAQATVQAASAKAGAYLSSWGAWAAEKKKAGWGSRSASPALSEKSAPDTDARRARASVGEQGGQQGLRRSTDAEKTDQ